MNMKKIILSVVLLYITTFSFAQTINGIVKVQRISGDVEPLPYASIYWLEGKLSLESDQEGKFTINNKGAQQVSLIATYIGYSKDTVVLSPGDRNAEFLLKEGNSLDEVRVVGRQEGNYISKMTPVKTEVISAAGLCKMACCNLAESFENSASVTVGYADAITGARQIKLLGLSGQYTQMLDENRPVMRGIAAPFGLSYIPGQWLESIQIAKGPSSVVNGIEAITGQINMEHTSDLVYEGKLIHEESYPQRSSKYEEVELNGIKVDFYDPRNKVIHEIKKSNKVERAHELQLKYYLCVFERNGIVGVTGILEYPILRKRDTVVLSEVDRETIKTIEEEIVQIVENENCPPLSKKNICRNCSYYEFCYSTEEEI